jgi:CDP-diacylglycerol--glycerol-3-phosphate 3-phosphatidyltransferase
MIGEPIAWFFTTLRDAIARALLKLHVTPNVLTVLGLAPAALAGWFFWQGRFAAGAWVVIASAAFDMLDGAVARLGDLKTPFGGILDSTVDRASDFLLFGGVALWFAFGEVPPHTPRTLYVILTFVVLLGAFGTSYVRARAECAIEKCHVGFWERGERIAAVIIAAFAGHIETLIWVLAIFGIVTSVQRLAYAWMVVTRGASHTDTSERSPTLRFLLWEYPRLSPIYDVTTALFIALLIFVDVTDWIG